MFRLFLGLLFMILVVSVSADRVSRCYACNSRHDKNCERLSAPCTEKFNCRHEFIQNCASNENSCAVIYNSDGHIWRGCYNDPAARPVSNDQICESIKDVGQRCVCQVEMCNTSSRNLWNFLMFIPACFALLYYV